MMSFDKPAQGVRISRPLRKYHEFSCAAYYWPPRQELAIKDSDRLYSFYTKEQPQIRHTFIMEVDMVADQIRTAAEAECAPNCYPFVLFNSKDPNASSDGLIFVLALMRDMQAGEELIMKTRRAIFGIQHAPRAYLKSKIAKPLPPLRHTLYEGLDGLLGVQEINLLREQFITVTAWGTPTGIRNVSPLHVDMSDERIPPHEYHQHIFRNRATMRYYEDVGIH